MSLKARLTPSEHGFKSLLVQYTLYIYIWPGTDELEAAASAAIQMTLSYIYMYTYRCKGLRVNPMYPFRRINSVL